MPELPEVETVIRVLKEWVLNKTIKTIKVIYDPILENKTTKEFSDELEGKTITDIRRKGKYILFYLNKTVLISHLRMEGKYFLAHYPNSSNKRGEVFDDNNYYLKKHTHVIFEMDDESLLLYHDVRKFGKFYLTDEDHLNFSPLGKLGLEPFEVGDPNYLFEKTRNNNQTIKEMLLDQTILLGIGNIYADEINYDCKLSPFRKASALTIDECNTIVKSARKILNKAIELGGSSVHSFSSGNHVDGKFQNELKVYGRDGQNCEICGTKIIKTKLGGRGTCFCPLCQSKIYNNVKIIGVTGLIASGKSIVSKKIDEYGYKLIDADELAHDCYESSSPCFNQIIDLFGSDIVVDGKIDRNIVSNRLNEDKLKKLENLIHPYVIKQIKEFVKKNSKVVMDVPLLFESKLNKICDLVVFVNTDENIRKQRMIERNKKIINLNNNEEEISKKMKLSDYIIDNSSTIEKTYSQVEKLIHKIEDYK